MSAGTYNVFVRYDNVTCEVAYASNSVVLTVPEAASITDVTFTEPTDCGNTDGTITITAVGGTGSLQYSVDSGVTYQASNVFTALPGDSTYYILLKMVITHVSLLDLQLH